MITPAKYIMFQDSVFGASESGLSDKDKDSSYGPKEAYNLSASGSGYYESVKPRKDNGKRGPKEDSIVMNMHSMPNNDDTEKYYTHEAPKIPLASTEVEVKGYESLGGVVKHEDRLI
jgi:hypothetical protein